MSNACPPSTHDGGFLLYAVAPIVTLLVGLITIAWYCTKAVKLAEDAPERAARVPPAEVKPEATLLEPSEHSEDTSSPVPEPSKEGDIFLPFNSFVNLFNAALSNRKIVTTKGGMKRIATVLVPNTKVFLSFAVGNIIDFNSEVGMIVNAANEQCSIGSGVTGALSKAGGESFKTACSLLPIVKGDDIRCPTGEAKVLGPSKFGKLVPNYIIQAVGPDYRKFPKRAAGDLQATEELGECNRLLRKVYGSALDLARMNRQVCFPIISGGSYRGAFKLRAIVELGLKGVLDWTSKLAEEKTEYNLTDIVWIARSYDDAKYMLKACDAQMGGTIKASVV